MNLEDLPADEWGLTPRERQSIHFVTNSGCAKLASVHTGTHYETVKDHLKEVRRKMGVRFTGLAMVKWDRFVREHSHDR